MRTLCVKIDTPPLEAVAIINRAALDDAGRHLTAADKLVLREQRLLLQRAVLPTALLTITSLQLSFWSGDPLKLSLGSILRDIAVTLTVAPHRIEELQIDAGFAYDSDSDGWEGLHYDHEPETTINALDH